MVDPLQVFEVFRDGSVLLPRGKLSYGSPDLKGYRRVSFKKKFYYVHRLVAMKYLENPNSLPQVNHKNMDTSDNRVENLEWCDNGHNVRHSYLNNKERKRQESGRSRKSKLTPDQVFWILDNLGVISERQMALQLGVTGRVIYHIKRGITHSNITGICKTEQGGTALVKEALRNEVTI